MEAAQDCERLRRVRARAVVEGQRQLVPARRAAEDRHAEAGQTCDASLARLRKQGGGREAGWPGPRCSRSGRNTRRGGGDVARAAAEQDRGGDRAGQRQPEQARHDAKPVRPGRPAVRVADRNQDCP